MFISLFIKVCAVIRNINKIEAEIVKKNRYRISVHVIRATLWDTAYRVI